MPRTMSTTQASEYFGVHQKTIQRWIRLGKLEASMVLGRWHVHVEEHDKEHHAPNEGHDIPHEEHDAPCDVRALKAQLERADSEIQHLREQLARREETIESLLQQQNQLQQLLAVQTKTNAALTEQLDAERQMIEDLRRRSWWKRLFRRNDT